MIQFNGKYTTANVMTDTLDEATAGQINTFINSESFSNPVVIMPDTHYGKGAVIGFTMEIPDRIIPNVVGVDESCGMYATKLNSTALYGIDFSKFDQQVRQTVPMSSKVHNQPIINMEKDFDWKTVMVEVNLFTNKFNKRFDTDYKPPEINYKWFSELCMRTKVDQGYAECSIGTMGGGNHFIELGIDENDNVWLVVHSGSRYLGKQNAEHWQRVAVSRLITRREAFSSEAINQIKDKYPPKEWNSRIKSVKNEAEINTPRGLEYLVGDDMYGYLVDNVFVYHYSARNRYEMARRVLSLVNDNEVLETVHTVHNYVNHLDFIIRKGAVSAKKGEYFVLPFNFEDGILICEGKGNPEWNYSAPHGAGRIYSRTKAKAMLKVDPVRERLETKGIYASVLPLDELPEAYKPAAEIEAAINPTASIIHRIKPIMNLKARK